MNTPADVAEIEALLTPSERVRAAWIRMAYGGCAYEVTRDTDGTMTAARVLTVEEWAAAARTAKERP